MFPFFSSPIKYLEIFIESEEKIHLLSALIINFCRLKTICMEISEERDERDLLFQKEELYSTWFSVDPSLVLSHSKGAGRRQSGTNKTIRKRISSFLGLHGGHLRNTAYGLSARVIVGVLCALELCFKDVTFTKWFWSTKPLWLYVSLKLESSQPQAPHRIQFIIWHKRDEKKMNKSIKHSKLW